MDYINDIQKNYDKMNFLKECDPSNDEISFDTPSHDIPGDANKPGDGSCSIFKEAGGNISVPDIVTGLPMSGAQWALYTDDSSHYWRRHVKFDETNTNSKTDDVFIVAIDQKNVCERINDKIADTKTVPADPTDIGADCSKCVDQSIICTQNLITGASSSASFSDTYFLHKLLEKDM